MNLKTNVTVGLAAVAMMTASQAQAADAYMGGLFGTTPGFNTMTGPQGEKCNSGLGGSCRRINYNNISTQSGKTAIERWVAQNGSVGNTIWVYSLSSNAMIEYLNENPDDQNTWIAVGSPSKPTAPNNAGVSNSLVLNPTQANVTFVTKYGDSVSMPNVPGSSFNTHVNGYRNLDARNPTTSNQVQPTVRDNVYGSPAVNQRVRFNLFDMRTWFQPRSITVANANVAQKETVVHTETLKISDAKVLEISKISEKPTRAEQRKIDREERKAEKAERRAERKAEREAKRAERQAERIERIENLENESDFESKNENESQNESKRDSTE